MHKRKHRKFLSAISFLLAFVLIMGSTLAYFTDRVDMFATGTAGTVNINLIPDVVMTDADGKDILNPGDGRQVNFTIQNLGNMSVDLRETIKVTCTEPMTNTGTQAEFELYKTSDIETNANGATVPKSGKSPITVKTVSNDHKTITYNVPVVTLDGNHNLAEYEIEPEANGKDTEEEEYTLIFRRDSSNDFQNQTVTIEKLVEAKQHRNTGESTWVSVASETFTFGNQDEVNVVPEEVTSATDPTLSPTPTPAQSAHNVTITGNHFTHDAPATIEDGENLVITLTPSTGFEFTNENQINVTGADAGTEQISIVLGNAVITIPSVSGEIEIEAAPEMLPSNPSINVSGSNFTHNAPSTISMGGNLTVTLTPDTGFEFTDESQINVTGDYGMDNVSIENGIATVEIEMIIGDVSIEATPVVTTHSVTVTGSNFTNNAPASVEDGDELTVVLTPATGYIFNNENQIVVTGDDAGTENVSISNGVATVVIPSVSGDVSIEGTPVTAPKAYAVLDNSGNLTMFRSYNTYTNKSSGTFYDTNGNSYTGKVYSNIENNNSSPQWNSDRTNIKSVDIADGYTITPLSTGSWFSGCNKLTAVDLTGLDTHNVTDMTYVFQNCSALTTLNLGDFDTSSATEMLNMFAYCSSLTNLALPDSFTTGKVTRMDRMFSGCEALTTLTLPGGFDTSGVKNMLSMFSNCSNLTTIYASHDFNTYSCSSDYNMFNGCTSLVGGNGTAYSTDHQNADYAKIDTAGTPGYFTYIEDPHADTRTYTTALVAKPHSVFTELRPISDNVLAGGTLSAQIVMKYDGYDIVSLKTNYGENAQYDATTKTVTVDNVDKNLVVTVEVYQRADYTATFENAKLSGESTSDPINGVYYVDYSSPVVFVADEGYYFENKNSIKGLTSENVKISRDHKTATVTFSGSGDYNLRVEAIAGEYVPQPVAYAVETSSEVIYFRSNEEYDEGDSGTFEGSLGDTYTGRIVRKEVEGEGIGGIGGWDVQLYNNPTSVRVANGYTIVPTEDMSEYFACNSLETVYLDGFDTSNVQYMANMFSNCYNLTTIYSNGSFDTSNVMNGHYMFDGCYALVGGNGTAYADCHVDDVSYAHVDTAGDPGYFTSSSSGSGSSGVTSGNAYVVFTNNNEMIFFRSDESYMDGETGTFEGILGDEYTGTIFGDIEDEKYDTFSWSSYESSITSARIADGYVIAPINAGQWFCGAENIETINLEGLDTSNTTNMSGMFNTCSSQLTTLTLPETFVTSSVEDMYCMFAQCYALETIYASNSFDTSSVTQSSSMFEDCMSLVGGNGTTYNPYYVSSNTDATYAHIDGENGQPGFFTARP